MDGDFLDIRGCLSGKEIKTSQCRRGFCGFICVYLLIWEARTSWLDGKAGKWEVMDAPHQAFRLFLFFTFLGWHFQSCSQHTKVIVGLLFLSFVCSYPGLAVEEAGLLHT